jgi:hypothetical protein
MQPEAGGIRGGTYSYKCCRQERHSKNGDGLHRGAVAFAGDRNLAGVERQAGVHFVVSLGNEIINLDAVLALK